MKLLQKYIYLLICTAAFIGIITYGFLQSSVTIPLSFIVSSGHGSEEINVFDAQDGNYYVFLPSYTDMSNVSFKLSSNQSIILGNTYLADGMSCSNYEFETAYPLSVEDRCVSTLWFYRSANVAAMYINTATGNMTRIHEDKTHKETASVTLYTHDGTIDLTSLKATIKGRGNSSWLYEKKPYVLEFSEASSLLGMPTAFRWVLLANALDETNLRNKLSYDLANLVCKEWVPQTAYVDVYLNGEYAGLYMLSEKLEIDNSGIDVDISQGDFLCRIEHPERRGTLSNPFMTQAGRTVEICAPELMTHEDRERIIFLTDQLEKSILSSSDLLETPFVDLDSFARRYLLDEVTANFDADTNSSYFYYKDGVFYAGPLWDYDLTFGIRKDMLPETFLVYANIPSHEKALYSKALYEDDDFYSYMTEVYQNDFLPVLEGMINTGIYEAGSKIAASSRMNSLRWRSMFDSLQGWNNAVGQTTEDLHSYFARRIEFLNRAWIDGVDFSTVLFQTDTEMFRAVTVESGSYLTEAHGDFENVQWVYGGTGEPFDPTQPVTKNLHLVALYENDDIDIRSAIAMFSVVILLCILAFAVWVDMRRRSQERSLADEATRAQISS